MHQENLLTLHKYRYLKWASLLNLICFLLYLLQRQNGGAFGSTFAGYTLGIIGALIIFALLLFGIRKRSYHSDLGTVKGWLSAHVYLGLSLILITTLHTGFQLGFNVQSMTYILTLIVLSSGIWGVSSYFTQPSIINNVLNGKSLEACGESMLEIDQESLSIAGQLGSDIQHIIEKSSNTPIFNSPLHRYFGNLAESSTEIAVTHLSHIYASPDQINKTTAPLIEKLYMLQLKRQLELKRIREYLRSKGWNEIWLVFHVSASFALLAALVTHVVSVFMYW